MMWRVLLLVVTVWSSEGKQLENKMGLVSDQCVNAMTSCSNRVLADGRCRTVWNSFVLQMIRSDMNNDCEIDDDDFENYLEIDFDTNHDDKLCKQEWDGYMMNVLGFTQEAASGIFQNKFKDEINGDCVDIDDALPEDVMHLKTEYLNSIMQDLSSFCSMNKNMDSNRDCWGLVSVCKNMAKNMKACRQLNLSNKKTLYDKLMLEYQTSDRDNNGLVTRTEFNSDLLNNYDSDKNGCITKREWVNRFMSFYHFTPEFAGSYYDSVPDINRDNCINISDFIFPPNGMSQVTRLATFMKHLIKMCEANPRLYTGNQDCAAVADSCRMHFDNLAECTPYNTNTCGLEAYSDCVSRQVKSGGGCTSAIDMFEVKFEKLKIGNQINDTCVANNINASPKQIVSPIFLFFAILLALVISQ